MTFEEWFTNFLHYEGEPTKDIAQAAWEAGYQVGMDDVPTAEYELPEGYVLVPVEPTEKMFKAGLGWRESDSELEGEYRMVYESYKAMIQAAQEEE
jgi:hypothetical protein